MHLLEKVSYKKSMETFYGRFLAHSGKTKGKWFFLHLVPWTMYSEQAEVLSSSEQAHPDPRLGHQGTSVSNPLGTL